MKKLIVIIVVVVLSLTGCGNRTETKTETKTEIKAKRFDYEDYRIIIDSETGVNYIFLYEEDDYGIKAMALTPLLDENGEVVITEKGGE